jgi:hypothetical protein
MENIKNIQDITKFVEFRDVITKKVNEIIERLNTKPPVIDGKKKEVK